MNAADIADSLYCLGAACAADLPEVEYHAAPRRNAKLSGFDQDIPTLERKTRRPIPDECQVFSFPQMWSHGSMGFGGMGTASMTMAQTTVILTKDNSAAVYWGRQLAYVIKKAERLALIKDICTLNTRSCADAAVTYANSEGSEVVKYGVGYAPK